MACLWRAIQDRKVHEGELPAPLERVSPGNSDLGTCGHFTLQDGMRCQFPRRQLVANLDAFLLALDAANATGQDPSLNADEALLLDTACRCFGGDVAAAHSAYLVGDSRCYQPTADDWGMASKLFNKDMALTQAAVRATATLAAGKMPTPVNGGIYLAEESWENDYLTGHTDFRDPGAPVVGDYKTTAKPPRGGWLPTKYLPQMAGYHLLTGCERVWVLLADSMRAKWATVIWIDFAKPEMRFYAEQVAAFCQFLMSDRLAEVAYPVVGDHCQQTWCAHIVDCHDLFMPPRGRVYNVAKRRKVVPRGPVALPAAFDPPPL
jgi:hypothetical protein